MSNGQRYTQWKQEQKKSQEQPRNKRQPDDETPNIAQSKDYLAEPTSKYNQDHPQAKEDVFVNKGDE